MKSARNYLFVSLFCAFFGGVYEAFSHGVYSYFMLYAFAFPLCLGTLPAVLRGQGGRGDRQSDGFFPVDGNCQSDGVRQFDGLSGGLRPAVHRRPAVSGRLWGAGIAALTTGSLFRGILDIYGTASGLSAVYWLAGGILLAAAVVTGCRERRRAA